MRVPLVLLAFCKGYDVIQLSFVSLPERLKPCQLGPAPYPFYLPPPHLVSLLPLPPTPYRYRQRSPLPKLNRLIIFVIPALSMKQGVFTTASKTLRITLFAFCLYFAHKWSNPPCVSYNIIFIAQTARNCHVYQARKAQPILGFVNTNTCCIHPIPLSPAKYIGEQRS